MNVHVNDETREFPDGSSVADVLAELGAARRGVAVALDGEVVRRGDWTATAVPDGARLEILTAVQGG
ncbi:sulfur carrier protein ThiS [Qaidamihabitans albus]|uniref:sulfur carrier protein ThiS n=1 Tax=Qaidamihabitans albus TaxID=2795733 RepID=UPI0018F129BB|nr:sulfur carrier protein ThiS [Qaidamihabitans albus]